MSSSSAEPEDRDIAIIKARKLRELREKAAVMEKAKEKEKERELQILNSPKAPSNKQVLQPYLYDRADEVLKLAESQFPAQTKAIIARLAELVRAGDIQQRISGGELLAVFRTVGLRVRVDTTIKVQDHGKMITFADKLKQGDLG